MFITPQNGQIDVPFRQTRADNEANHMTLSLKWASNELSLSLF